jgi:NTP pyrophosphatase (non-canonical NTP hydrolase)
MDETIRKQQLADLSMNTSDPSKTNGDSLRELADELAKFARDRDWEQFHSPKNLASALVVEAGELLEPFQWLTDEQSKSLPPAKLNEVRLEIADVLLYLVQLSSALKIDPVAAAREKLALNRDRYPADLARGNSTKYTSL